MAHRKLGSAGSAIAGVILATALTFVAPVSQGLAQEAGFAGSFMVSDDMVFDRQNNTIEAHGNVELFYDGLKLQAPSVVYDAQADRVSVAGPITLVDAGSGSTTFADFAELSGDMQDMLLIAVRHVMQDQLQVAADEMERTDARVTEWRSVVASYCQVCADRPTPLWEIRARSARHDQAERMMYFRHAQFRVAGVPLAYTPYLRMPDPTVDRANGFVRSSIRSSTLTGTTLRLPYFIVMGDHADLTVVPGLSFGGNASLLNTVEARYRRAFAYGGLEINGAVTQDDLTDRSNRAYIFANGDFAYPSGLQLSFQIQSSSDRTYLTTYNFFDGKTETFTGRELNFNNATLTSFVNLSRIAPDEVIRFDLRHLNSLQPRTVTTDHPSHILNGEYARWFDIDGIGGDFVFSTVAQADYNEYGPTNGRQRDIARIFTGLQWRESWEIAGGVVVDGELAGFGDLYRISDDASLPGDQSTLNGLAVTALRWPQSRTSPTGVRHDVEPFIRQIAFSGDRISVPDVDGTIDNFDPNNRFDLARFRRIDRNRDLQSTELGVDYTAHFPSGWSAGGRVERDFFWNAAPGEYSGGALYTGRLGYRAEGLTFNASRAFNSDFYSVSDRLSLSYTWDSGSLTSSYARIGIDPVLSTTSRTDLLTVGVSWQPSDAFSLTSNLTRDREASDASFASSGIEIKDVMGWSTRIAGNYSIDDDEFDTRNVSVSRKLDWGGDANVFFDFDREEQRSLGLKLDYVNECVNVQSQILRRRSVINNANAATELSLTVEFGGFGGRGTRSCG